MVDGLFWFELFTYRIPSEKPANVNVFIRALDSWFPKFQSDIIQVVSVWSQSCTFDVDDAAAIKEITASRYKWIKQVDSFVYRRVEAFGKNIITTEGDVWRLHRKIVSPAFSESNNKLTWSEAKRITLNLTDVLWKDQDTIKVKNVHEITVTLALYIISSAGFGKPISFDENTDIPPGHTMTFKDALHIVSIDMTLGIAVPNWAMGLTNRLRTYWEAYQNFMQYMREMINDRRVSGKGTDGVDLFSNLLEGNSNGEDDSSSARLSESELIGNIFMFLLAGHETTANTLCFALGLLALHQEEQEDLYQQIISVLQANRDPRYEDLNSLKHCLAVIYETLRLFPPAPRIVKQATEDAILTTTNEAGEQIAVTVPKGSEIGIRIGALQRNPRYWRDPEQFNPKRFMEDWDRNAFIPFGDGARACIGRRFAETELIAMLTILISRFKVEVLDEPQFAGETFEQRKTRVLATIFGLTVTPVRVPLVFKRRK